MELLRWAAGARGSWCSRAGWCVFVASLALSRESRAASWIAAWDAPDGCPVAAQVDAMIEEVLEPEGESSAELTARAVVRPALDGTWHLELVVEREGVVHRRTLSGKDCAEVSEAAALVVALSIDPRALEKRAAQESLDEATPPESSPSVLDRSSEPEPFEAKPKAQTLETSKPRPVATAPNLPPPSQPCQLDAGLGPGEAERCGYGSSLPDREWDRLHLVLGVDGLADAGSLPALTVGPAPLLAVSERRYRFEAFAGYLPDQRGSVPESNSAARVHLWFAGLRGCLGMPFIGPCASLEGGALSGRGEAVTHARRRRIWWGAAVAELAGVWPLGGRFGVRAGLGLGIPFNRDYFDIAGAGEAHRPSPIFGRGFFGVEGRFL